MTGRGWESPKHRHPLRAFRLQGGYLVPILPNLGGIAHGGLFPVADNGSAQQFRTIHKFLQLVLIIRQVPDQRRVRMIPIDQGLQAYRAADTGELSPADAVFAQIDALYLDAPLFKLALCLFGIKAFAGAKALNVHGVSLTKMKRGPQ